MIVEEDDWKTVCNEAALRRPNASTLDPCPYGWGARTAWTSWDMHGSMDFAFRGEHVESRIEPLVSVAPDNSLKFIHSSAGGNRVEMDPMACIHPPPLGGGQSAGAVHDCVHKDGSSHRHHIFAFGASSTEEG